MTEFLNVRFPSPLYPDLLLLQNTLSRFLIFASLVGKILISNQSHMLYTPWLITMQWNFFNNSLTGKVISFLTLVRCGILHISCVVDQFSCVPTCSFCSLKIQYIFIYCMLLEKYISLLLSPIIRIDTAHWVLLVLKQLEKILYTREQYFICLLWSFIRITWIVDRNWILHVFFFLFMISYLFSNFQANCSQKFCLQLFCQMAKRESFWIIDIRNFYFLQDLYISAGVPDVVCIYDRRFAGACWRKVSQGPLSFCIFLY